MTVLKNEHKSPVLQEFSKQSSEDWLLYVIECMYVNVYVFINLFEKNKLQFKTVNYVLT